MKFYTWVNHIYLSEKQFGIQSAHVLGELMVKYNGYVMSDTFPKIIHRWAKDHKTMVMLKGGTSAGLIEKTDILRATALPWATFNEDEASLNGALTAIGIVVTSPMCAAIDKVLRGEWTADDKEIAILGPANVELIRLITTSHLA